MSAPRACPECVRRVRPLSNSGPSGGHNPRVKSASPFRGMQNVPARPPPHRGMYRLVHNLQMEWPFHAGLVFCRTDSGRGSAKLAPCNTMELVRGVSRRLHLSGAQTVVDKSGAVARRRTRSRRNREPSDTSLWPNTSDAFWWPLPWPSKTVPSAVIGLASAPGESTCMRAPGSGVRRLYGRARRGILALVR